ncbi:MAG: SDR family oxidoreductase [Candidatus Berkelbacteria bacterium]
MNSKRILVLGATGMLGNALFTELSKADFDVYGTARKMNPAFFPENLANKIIADIDIEDLLSLSTAIKELKPDVVMNCVGLIKQSPSASNTAMAIYMNALFPHRLASICEEYNARMIHFSTDCVFSGKKGNYTEKDFSDAGNVYGRTKYLGEVVYPHCFTMRTSIIGHGLETNASLVDWFLAQEGDVTGYDKVIFSGFPTVEIARILTEYILPNHELSGLYHVSADPISKYDLLKLVAKVYSKKVNLISSDNEVSDKSLNSDRFRKISSYTPPSWDVLIEKMYEYYKSNSNFIKYT